MLDNKNSEEALLNLKAVAKSNVANKKLKEQIEKITVNRIPLGKTEDLLRDDIDIETYFLDVEIYWLMKAFYEVTQNSLLNVKKHFTDTEILKYENYILDEGEISNTIILKNVKQVAPNIYHCYSCSFEDIKYSQENGITIYDYRMQREATLVEKGGELITKATVIAKNVEDIEKSMSNNTFTPNTITWNILKNGGEDFEYFPETETLRLTKSNESLISIVDGYHRTIAIANLLSKGVKVDNDFMYVNILNYSVEEAQRFIRQEQQGTKLTKTQQKLFKNDSFISIAKQLNASGTKDDNSLKDRMAEINLEVYKYNTKIVTIESVADTLKTFYKKHIKTPRDNRLITDWIIKFMIEVMGKYNEEFNDIEKSKKTKAITYNNMINVFIGLSEYFYTNKKSIENWESKLEELLDSIDFDINSNEIWNKNLITTKRWDTTAKKGVAQTVKYIIEMFEKNK